MYSSDDDDEDDYGFEGLQSIIISDTVTAADDGAKLKFKIIGTDFDHGDESQPGNIVDEEIGDGAMAIQADITKVIHGRLRPNGPPATLIVFQFAFVPHGNNNRFKNAEVTITFSAGEVRGISPSNTWTTLPSEKQQERSHTISPSLEASLGPAKAATTYSWSRKETETIKGYAKVTGEIKATRNGLGRKKKNTVQWGLYEDEQANSGIPSLLGTALLLEREATDKKPPGDKFTASIRIHGNVNRRVQIKNKMEDMGKWMTGGTREGRDIVFRPEQPNKGTAVLGPDSLQNEDLDAYRQLISIREWETPGGTNVSDENAASESASKLQVPPAGPKLQPLAVTPVSQASPEPSASGDGSAQVLGNYRHIQALKLTDPPVPTTQPDGEPIVGGPNLPVLDPESVMKPGANQDKPVGELVGLREQLQLVRAETKWAVHIIGLLAEERRLLQQIKQLEVEVRVDGM